MKARPTQTLLALGLDARPAIDRGGRVRGDHRGRGTRPACAWALRAAPRP